MIFILVLIMFGVVALIGHLLWKLDCMSTDLIEARNAAAGTIANSSKMVSMVNMHRKIAEDRGQEYIALSDKHVALRRERDDLRLQLVAAKKASSQP